MSATSAPRPGPLAAGRLLRLPYAFELGVPLLVAALMAGAWTLDPAGVGRTGERLGALWHRLQLTVLLRPLADIGRDALAVKRGPDGRMWVMDKYGVRRFGPQGQEVLLDRARYRAAFGHTYNALSSLWLAGADEAFVGSWYGELFHYRRGQWRELSARGEPLGKRIHAVAGYRDQVYLATDSGVWRWREGEGLQRVEALPLAAARALVPAPDRLYAGVGDQVWQLDGAGWRPHWQGAEADREVTALQAADEGALRVGTRDGLVSLGPDGTPHAREIPGLQVTVIQPGPDGLWVGTWGGGLRLRQTDGWRTLGESEGMPDGDVTDLAIGDGQLWATLYGAGAVRAALPTLMAGSTKRIN